MKVLIVDDDALIRESLSILLDLEDEIEIIGTCANGQEAFDFCKNNRPDIVLMDIRMPIMDGVLGTKVIKESFKDIKVVILTTFKDDEYIKEALKNGAEGYILKNQSSDSIIDSLKAVVNGNMVFEQNVAKTISNFIKEDKSNNGLEQYNLTEREMEVLRNIGDGLSNKEIASKLYLSEGTVRNYITSLLEKLELRDRTQLAIFYLKNS
ncbi:MULTISPECIES: response regulator transcription factor [Clostridium]|uniref:Stage 0 sporulation protein A homolog n=1 Tax=Clostridium acetobutylicum (strain ATCC 824 / DSM 792 / JCM 1419 / IAM 19013 / LMG 5710 / NBRC 13948 / NRRL B-527 / VKM B-1787 / 2291 / W) TaxID=272562 RepID=Q97MF8_CLOAB|nr:MULTISPECIES: response regulator transcription factor [Clostridium]AAK78221.1 Response regulator (CheY-like recever domain and HTH DNA-binding domain) [Clostridium acetobutylicum ATCC 824]ADZ19287.1 Response regulator (CheY-like recever domain and HTH DNA-binding domain) [Clostridium acetobutylicum EA 2018]AEI34301.1 response regulator [Clostridium acetobutylicum DSM 1731]AWV82029.1 DNA-binding response regulator [Clostridium acetobutylicum]KHD34664.1 LuxR family transcriptional regulator [